MPQQPQASPTPDPVLAAFRKSIDNIDAALIHILAERFRITKLSEDADLDPEFSEKFLRFIIDEVIRHHERAQKG